MTWKIQTCVDFRLDMFELWQFVHTEGGVAGPWSSWVTPLLTGVGIVATAVPA